MKIGVISDTHSLPLPKKLIEALTKMDLIIHAGDICDVDTIKTLRAIKPLKAVQGNMCDVVLKSKLPFKEILEYEGIRIGVCHGHGAKIDALSNAQSAFKDEKVNMIIFGHSHLALNQTINGVLYFNPGSPNDVVKAKFFSYGVIEILKGRLKAEIIKL